MSGFEGSAGTVVITNTSCGLWTDSRYFLEAETAIKGTSYELHRLGEADVVDFPEWLARSLDAGTTVGIDGACVSTALFRTLFATLLAAGITLRPTKDPFAVTWTGRPALPSTPLFVHEERYTGESATARLMRIRRELERREARSHVVCTLDDIAWLLNVRAADVSYNPLAVAFLTIDRDSAALFTQLERINERARAHLRATGVDLHPYDAFWSVLPRIERPVWLDPERTTVAIAAALDSRVVHMARPEVCIETVQPSTGFKAVKNEAELNHTRNTMVRDGVAMVRFLRWLDDAVAAGQTMGETEVSAKLREFRSQLPNYIGDSFEYISGFGGHGAIIHYRAKRESEYAVRRDGVYLIDSGAQYLDGTTDITRTVCTGDVEQPAKEDFTYVLKAHIALAGARFPAGTSGRQLDPLARRPLWDADRNFGHGTGHGVGYFLNVHEGPHRIAQLQSDWPLQPGMIISNEPGVYRRDRWGIRIENLVVVVADGVGDFGPFYAFETLSVCPIDRRMILSRLLSLAERDWIDAYHEHVRTVLEPHLEAADAAWLRAATEPLAD